MSAIIAYYIVITLGYLWAFVQVLAGQPFDALVLFVVTFMFNMYRNAVVYEREQDNNMRRD